MIDRKQLSAFINTFKTANVEHFGVVFHGSDKSECVGVKMIKSGDHKNIKGISLQHVLDEATKAGAKAMTLIHNHPKTGQDKLRPSVADLETTFAIHDASKKDGVPVLNHIIYGADNSAFSFIHNGIEI
jgi:DNA repair protein RadC